MILSVAGVLLGAWWAPFPVAFAFGFIECHVRIALPVGATIGLGGWTVPLAALGFRFGIGSTAQSLSAILGLGHQGAFAVTLTLLIGVLLGLTGGWLGSSIRSQAGRQPLISRNRETVSSDGSTPSSSARSLRKSK
jgi:hypothetical protein